MKHYTREQWSLLGQGKLSRNTEEQMENHLYSCEHCMESFLDVINADDMKIAEEIIPPDFTDSTAAYIKKKSRTKTSISSKARSIHRRQNLIVCYAAAAILTLIFMGGGVFESLVDNYAKISTDVCTVEHKKMQESMGVTWADNLTSKTADWIEKFESSY